MKKPMLYAVVGVSLAVGAGIAANKLSHSSPEPGGAPKVVLPALKPIARQPTNPAAPLPGVHVSKPSTCVVLVPKTVDPAFAIAPGNQLDNCIINPQLRLEPKK
jgi:hypothetical protein